MLSIFPPLEGTRIVLRDSMKKFESNSSSLEILKVSEPRFVFLNRQLVNILNQKGVVDEVFLSVERDRLRDIIESFHCASKAIDFVRCYSSLRVNFERLQTSSIDILSEPLFRNILEIGVSQVLNEMKSKTRIRLPDDWGRVLLGILDEYGILEEGQIFLQISEKENYLQRRVITGEILVTKFPCLHPGDVRKFEAVDIPRFNELYCDVIVFPQKGSRPHPDEMAGSDLDGDEFAAIWHKPLIFPGDNYIAMDYSNSSLSLQQFRQVEVSDMLQFYSEFAQKNNVGVIANAHLALSDQLEQGIFDPVVLKLAKLESIALDFAKTGFIVHPPIPPHFYPDFMEKSESKPTYRSERALGKLYRLCCLFEEIVDLNGLISITYADNTDMLTFPGWERFEDEAESAYFDYRNRIINLQKQYGIESEAVLLSGLSPKLQKYVCGKNEREDVQMMIRSLVKNIFDDFQYNFDSGEMEIEFDSYNEKRMAKASAWYLVTKRLNAGNKNPYYGLPWIVSDVLCDIAYSKSSFKHTCVVCSGLSKFPPVNNFNRRLNMQLVEQYFKMWLENNLKRCKGHVQHIKPEVFYNEHVKQFVNEMSNDTDSSDKLIIERIFQNMCCYFNENHSKSEMWYAIGLSALMSRCRLKRTNKLDEKDLVLSEDENKKSIKTICLSLEDREFKDYVTSKRTQAEFFQKLKASGVEDICCQVYEQKHPRPSYLFVTAVGKRKNLKALRLCLTRKTFYREVLQTLAYE
ncbi:RNA-dependent RNA polymerase 1-like protein, partial [Dinothrombium tinctorium]